MSHDQNDGGAGDGGQDGGGGDGGNPNGFISVPLSMQEILARRHAILCSVGFLILLPLGVLLARYTRTFLRQ